MLKKFDFNILLKPSILLIAFVTCFTIITMDLWRPWHLLHKTDNQFKWDVAGYYSYLTGDLIYHNYDSIKGDAMVPLIPAPLGGKMTKATYGMALLYSPFFALGYKVAINEHKPLDGYSEPFAICLHWGSIFYALLGLLLLRNLLIKFYSEKVTSITLAVIFFGTNLFFYTLSSSEMTHSYLFFLYAAMLLASYHWYKQTTYLKSILVGLIIGVITLIRPTEVIACVLFLFVAMKNGETIKQRFNYLFKHWPQLLLIGLFVIIVWIPQFLIWKAKTGNYFFFSYPGERFFWDDPQIINILFSYRKGWFVYTPLILLSFIGLFFMKKELAPLRNCILIITLLNIYILSCWWDWFFGGGFGGRCFVQHYAYLSIPIAALTQYVIEKMASVNFKPLLKFAFLVILFFGMCLNVGQTYQYNQAYIHFNAMTKKAYWHMFGRYKIGGLVEQQYWGSLSEPDYQKILSGEDRDQ